MESDEKVLNGISEFQERGYCVLRNHFDPSLIEAFRSAFWARLLAYLSAGAEANRGPYRHFIPLPFQLPSFAPQFFFNPDVLSIVRGLMDERIVADQWGCDVPVLGSEHQAWHVDYQRPLFPEKPELPLPPFAIVVSFGLVHIETEHGPIEIAEGTHRMTRADAHAAIQDGSVPLATVALAVGDVLIRHPWALHRGTPNTAEVPRALATIRYVRRWYTDGSREVQAIPREVWNTLNQEQQSVMRFPLEV